jgi:8-oxo-dGTP pyrophosphatase MutT (NUDIX family)
MDTVNYRAAGGIVIRGTRVLLLERPSRDEMRLPKGHVEAGEAPQEAALREVREETGYKHPAILADLGSQQVQFTDPYKGQAVTRDEHYYLMRLRDEEQVAPQKREKQFQPLWVPLQQALEQLTFKAEQEFVRRALKWMETHETPGTHAANT